MAVKTISMPDGSQVKAIEMPFRIQREDWNEYFLEDGAQVRVRTTIGKIYRLLDNEGQPALTPEGDPQVYVTHRTEVITSA